MDAEFWWRMVLLALSGFLGGTTIVIALKYYHAWRTHTREDWRGLLPLHVFTVSLSYNFLLLYSTVETYLRIGTDDDIPWWRAALLIPAYVFGFVAMRAMWKLRRKKRLVEDHNLR